MSSEQSEERTKKKKKTYSRAQIRHELKLLKPLISSRFTLLLVFVRSGTQLYLGDGLTVSLRSSSLRKKKQCMDSGHSSVLMK